MTVDEEWLGIHIKNQGALAGGEVISCALRAEELGFSAVSVNEDIGHDAFAMLGAMSTVTNIVKMATAISNVYCRSAMQLAMAVATVDDLSNGRAVLGLSIGHHPWNDQYHGIPIESPLTRIREYVRFIKGVLTGNRYSADGKCIGQVDAKMAFKPMRQDIPILVGGNGPKLLSIAAKESDGAIVNHVSGHYIESFVADHLSSSARAAGRDPKDIELVGIVTCCLAEDRKSARSVALDAFMRSFRSNPGRIIRESPQQFEQDLRALESSLWVGDELKARDRISEKLLSDRIAFGNADDIRAVVQRFYVAGCTKVMIASYSQDLSAISGLIEAMAPRRDRGA